MRVCGECGFVFNAEFDAARLQYGPHYDNTQDCSPTFGHYLDELVRHLVEDLGLRGKRIVEVGCGKGAFLRRLVTYPGAGNEGVGFDPSYVGPESDLDGKLVFHRREYGDGSAVPADVVVCRHVIEHLADPVGLLRSVRATLATGQGTRVFFETPSVRWILRNQVFWDFFYEHCALFSTHSLRTAFEEADFCVDTVRHVFEGQYLWAEASPGGPDSTHRDAEDTEELAIAFGRDEQRLAASWKQTLPKLSDRGGVALWGAGAKGSTFANLADPEGRLIDCVVDLNPNKQGRFLPGTGHPIVGYPELARRRIENVILMNPNYREEIAALLVEERISANLIESHEA